MSRRKNETLNDALDALEEAQDTMADETKFPADDMISKDIDMIEKDVQALTEERDAFKAQANDFKDKFLRAKADMENYHRRIQEELEKTKKYASERVWRDLFPILDSFEQALQVNADAKDAMLSMQEGISLTLKMFLDVMTKFGVEVINPQDAVYDPHLHEAMTVIPHPDQDAGKSGIVLEVIQKGYRLHGRLLRPARVVVSK